MKKKLKLPKFANETAERNFWSKHDLSDYFTKEDFQKVNFPNLKPTSHSISIRIPEIMLYELKVKANKVNIPYQSLIKSYIAVGIAKK
ncbi:MAG: BrnA antitoxin family protein [bacterium]